MRGTYTSKLATRSIYLRDSASGANGYREGARRVRTLSRLYRQLPAMSGRVSGTHRYKGAPWTYPNSDLKLGVGLRVRYSEPIQHERTHN